MPTSRPGLVACLPLVALTLLLAAGGATPTRAQEEGDAPADAPTEAREILPAGEWAFVTHASTTFGGGAIDLHRWHVGATRMLTPSVGLELVGTAGVFDREKTVDGPAADGPTAGFDAIVRWHYHRAVSWSAYLEGGIGLLWTGEPIPAAGSEWNFASQVGLGLTRRVGEKSHLLFGARFAHVSHGSILDDGRNPGHDTGVLHVGFIRRD